MQGERSREEGDHTWCMRSPALSYEFELVPCEKRSFASLAVNAAEARVKQQAKVVNMDAVF